MREVSQFSEKVADGLLVDFGILARPVIFVAESPQQDAGMVIVLHNHGTQSAARHLFEGVVADATAAPGNLLPDEDAETVAEFQYPPRLLVVSKTNEVRAHLLDEVHLLLDQVVRHCCGVACVIFMAVRSAEKQPFAVELEGSVVDPFRMTNAKGLASKVSPAGAGKRNTALVEVRVGGTPQVRLGEREVRKFLRAGPGSDGLLFRLDRGALSVDDLNREIEGVAGAGRIVERADDVDLSRSCG